MSASILQVQQALKALGYDPGPLDGIMGPRTAAATRAFQAAHPPLAVDGDPGPQTQAALAAAISARTTPAPAPDVPPAVVPGVPGVPVPVAPPVVPSDTFLGLTPLAWGGVGVAGAIASWLLLRKKRGGRR